MKPFISFKISGIQGDIISGDIRSFTVTDDLIETVEISQTDDAICGLKFTLKDTITLDSDVVAKMINSAKVFLVNMYGKLQPSIRSFNLKVEDTYDPKQEQTDNIKVFNTICFAENISFIRRYSIDKFKDFFGKKSPRPDADNTYMLLFNIMKIDNIVTRYLMQYELLLNLVAPNHLQKEITGFIRDVYNPTTPDKIGFHQTRRPERTYDEDNITYYRNLLGHNDASEEVTDDKINWFSNALAKILLFALNRD